jgi:hypothetical protein
LGHAAKTTAKSPSSGLPDTRLSAGRAGNQIRTGLPDTRLSAGRAGNQIRTYWLAEFAP